MALKPPPDTRHPEMYPLITIYLVILIYLYIKFENIQQSISITDLYDLLSQKLGKTEAKTLVEFVEAKIEREFEDKTSILATKGDISILREDIQHIKFDLVKWMFGIFVTLVVLILGLYATVIFKH